MSEKKIKKSIDAIEPRAGAKERMYQNILKKAEQQAKPVEEPPIQKTRPIRFIRYALPVAACFCLLVIGITRFLPGNTPFAPDDSDVQIGTPFTEVKNAEAFEKIGIEIDAPNRANNVSYAIIDGKIANIDFEIKSHQYTFCASAQSGDFSGISGEVLQSEIIDAKSNAMLETIDGGVTQYLRVSWTNGKVTYYLTNSDGASNSEIKELALELIK